MNMRGLVYPREELRRQEAKNALEEYRKTHTAAPGITDNMIEQEHERRRKPDDRVIAVPTDRRDGSSSWPKAWNKHQKSLPENEPRPAYTFGLDSGCVNGGELSALVIEATAEGVKHEVKSIKCKKEDKKSKKEKSR
uniref:Ser thr protein phosphatase family n=1 Tax=Colletotrichum fructicola (strain Nara gc5) TaxID=1213859 RepID=L2GAZ6_COLFN